LLLAIPAGVRALHTHAPLFCRFLCIGVIAFFAFAFGYEIPDPEGFFLPVVVLLSVFLGAAAEPLLRGVRPLMWGALAVLLAFPIAAHLAVRSRTSAFDLVEDVGNETGQVLWDLDDLFEHLPVGARFAVPCSHYGCVQVLQYYRFAAPVVSRRGIELVRLPNVDANFWDVETKIRTIDYNRARSETVCSIRKPDANAMRDRGIVVDELLRPSRDVAAGTKQGVTIYCSRPAS
jgi:hypothetical protein